MTVSGTGYEVEREHIIGHGLSTRDWMGMTQSAEAGGTSEYMIFGCWTNSRVRQWL